MTYWCFVVEKGVTQNDWVAIAKVKITKIAVCPASSEQLNPFTWNSVCLCMITTQTCRDLGCCQQGQSQNSNPQRICVNLYLLNRWTSRKQTCCCCIIIRMWFAQFRMVPSVTKLHSALNHRRKLSSLLSTAETFAPTLALVVEGCRSHGKSWVVTCIFERMYVLYLLSRWAFWTRKRSVAASVPGRLLRKCETFQGHGHKECLNRYVMLVGLSNEVMTIADDISYLAIYNKTMYITSGHVLYM